MKFVVQRVTEASVTVDEKIVGKIIIMKIFPYKKFQKTQDFQEMQFIKD